MQLDDRAGEHLQRIENGNRREGKGGRIDDDAGGAGIGRLVDPADDLALGIRLVEPHRPLAGRLAAHLPDFSQRGLAVDLRLALAEPVEVGPVEDEQGFRSEEHTSELQSLMRISYAVFCLKKKKKNKRKH